MGNSRHCSFKTAKVGKGGKHARYINGTGSYADRTDVVSVIDKNLPSWSSDATEFFDAADNFERKNGRVYTEIEFAIPREITDPVSFAQSFADKLLGSHHPFRLAVHDKLASDGKSNTHGHLMFSERRLDGIERSKEQFFSRANKKCPETGGTAKDRSWHERTKVQDVRDLYQAHALENGVKLDLRSNEAQGLGKPEPKIGVNHTRSSLNQARKSRIEEVETLRSSRIAIAATKTAQETILKEKYSQTYKKEKNSTEVISVPISKIQSDDLGSKNLSATNPLLASVATEPERSPSEILRNHLKILTGSDFNVKEWNEKYSYSGAIFAGKDGYLAMHLGKDDVLLINPKDFPDLKIGHAYSIKPTGIGIIPIKNRLSAGMFGESISSDSLEWAERDKKIFTQDKNKSLGR